MLPLGSVPDPENDTDPPGLIVTLVAGLVIVAVGSWFADTTSVTPAVRVTGPLVPRIVKG